MSGGIEFTHFELMTMESLLYFWLTAMIGGSLKGEFEDFGFGFGCTAVAEY